MASADHRLKLAQMGRMEKLRRLREDEALRELTRAVNLESDSAAALDQQRRALAQAAQSKLEFYRTKTDAMTGQAIALDSILSFNWTLEQHDGRIERLREAVAEAEAALAAASEAVDLARQSHRAAHQRLQSTHEVILRLKREADYMQEVQTETEDSDGVIDRLGSARAGLS
jgi:chromosome segregation ATPase